MAKERELPWFPKYVDDWMGSEFVITLDDAAYRSYDWLLCVQWKKGSLPAEERQIGALCGRTPKEFKRIWSQLATAFPLDEDGRRRNPRLHEERLKQEEKRDKLAGNRIGKTKNRTTNDESIDPTNEEETLFNSKTNGESNGGTDVNFLSRGEPRYIENTNSYLGCARVLSCGGPVHKSEGPVDQILRDDEQRQEWVSESGEHFVRVNGVTDSRGQWKGNRS